MYVFSQKKKKKNQNALNAKFVEAKKKVNVYLRVFFFVLLTTIIFSFSLFLQFANKSPRDRVIQSIAFTKYTFVSLSG